MQMGGAGGPDNVPVYHNVIPVNAVAAPGAPGGGGGGHNPGSPPPPGPPGQHQQPVVNPEEEELPLYPQFAVQHLDDEDEADNIWVADGHAMAVAEVHAAEDD